MTLADLAGYTVIAREPVCGAYRVWRICGMGPPSSGAIAVQQMLGLLEARDLARKGAPARRRCSGSARPAASPSPTATSTSPIPPSSPFRPAA